ncbi:MAG: exonuclease domain-containing protein, partial [Armatimonadota bacterium]
AAWVIEDDKAIRHSFVSQIVRPDGFEIPPGASNVHGITTERALAEGEEIHGVLDALAAAAAGASRIVAHNAAFDGPVIAAEYFRMGRTPPFDPSAMRCTMETGKHFTKIPGRYGDWKWPTLHELHNRLFLEGFDGAHDAGADVAACARCYYGLLQRGFWQ